MVIDLVHLQTLFGYNLCVAINPYVVITSFKMQKQLLVVGPVGNRVNTKISWVKRVKITNINQTYLT